MRIIFINKFLRSNVIAEIWDTGYSLISFMIQTVKQKYDTSVWVCTCAVQYHAILSFYPLNLSLKGRFHFHNAQFAITRYNNLQFCPCLNLFKHMVLLSWSMLIWMSTNLVHRVVITHIFNCVGLFIMFHNINGTQLFVFSRLSPFSLKSEGFLNQIYSSWL